MPRGGGTWPHGVARDWLFRGISPRAPLPDLSCGFSLSQQNPEPRAAEGVCPVCDPWKVLLQRSTPGIGSHGSGKDNLSFQNHLCSGPARNLSPRVLGVSCTSTGTNAASSNGGAGPSSWLRAGLTPKPPHLGPGSGAISTC